MAKLLILLVFSCLFSIALMHRGPSDKPFATKSPVYSSTSHSLKPTSLWGNIKAPFPTNADWTNFVLDEGHLPAAPLPFVLNAFPSGLLLSYPNLHCNEAACFGFPTNDLLVSAQGISDSSKHQVLDYDKLSLTMQWTPSGGAQSMTQLSGIAKSASDCVPCFHSDAQSCLLISDCLTSVLSFVPESVRPIVNCPVSPPQVHPPVVDPPIYVQPPVSPPVASPPSVPPPSGNGQPGVIYGIVDGHLVSHIVYGSPFVTFKYGNLIPHFHGHQQISRLNGESEKTASGSKFIVEIGNGNRYAIFALNGPLTLNWEGNSLKATEAYNGVIRVAISPSADHDQLLEKHLSPYPIAGHVKTSFQGDQGHIEFHWISEGEGNQDDILVLTLPHHRDVLVNAQFSSQAWKSLKGPMLALSGSVWKMVEPLSNIDYDSPRSISSPEHLEAVRSAVLEDAFLNVPIPSDTYSFGKVASRFARIALIANEINESAARDKALDQLDAILTPWFKRVNSNVLLYDSTWGGIISQLGRDDSGAEYGQGWYNDQHFHYGYYLYASSVLGRFRPDWATEHLDAINDLARNIANPSPLDTHYPVTRHKDWYVGHSWASGLFPFGDAKNQESTSESVNGYYGLYLWGKTIGDDHMRDFGRLLMQTEIRSTQKYWHMDPSDKSIYSSPFVEHTCIGIVWSTKVDYATWFGLQVEFIHAIQMLPYTPITEELLPKKWIQIEYPLLAESLTRPDPVILEGWKGFVFMTQSIINKEEAWKNALTLKEYDNGNSKSNTLHFIATRP